jgi:hypothetical protein
MSSLVSERLRRSSSAAAVTPRVASPRRTTTPTTSTSGRVSVARSAREAVSPKGTVSRNPVKETTSVKSTEEKPTRSNRDRPWRVRRSTPLPLSPPAEQTPMEANECRADEDTCVFPSVPPTPITPVAPKRVPDVDKSTQCDPIIEEQSPAHLALMSAYEELQLENQRLVQTLEQTQERISELDGLCHRQKEQSNVLEEMVQRMEGELAVFQKTCENERRRAETYAQAVLKVDDMLQEATQRLTQLEQEHQQVTRRLEEEKIQAAHQAQSLRETKAQLEEKAERLCTLEAEYTRVVQDKETWHRLATKHYQMVQDIQLELDTTKRQLDEALEEKNAMKKELQNTHEAMHYYKERCCEYESEVNVWQQERTRMLDWLREHQVLTVEVDTDGMPVLKLNELILNATSASDLSSCESMDEHSDFTDDENTMLVFDLDGVQSVPQSLPSSTAMSRSSSASDTSFTGMAPVDGLQLTVNNNLVGRSLMDELNQAAQRARSSDEGYRSPLSSTPDDVSPIKKMNTVTDAAQDTSSMVHGASLMAASHIETTHFRVSTPQPATHPNSPVPSIQSSSVSWSENTERRSVRETDRSFTSTMYTSDHEHDRPDVSGELGLRALLLDDASTCSFSDVIFSSSPVHSDAMSTTSNETAEIFTKSDLSRRIRSSRRQHRRGCSESEQRRHSMAASYSRIFRRSPSLHASSLRLTQSMHVTSKR